MTPLLVALALVCASSARSDYYRNGSDGTIPAADRGSSLLARVAAVNADGRETTVSTRSTGPILGRKD